MPAVKQTSTGKSSMKSFKGVSKSLKSVAGSALSQPAKVQKVVRKDFREAATEAAERYKGSMQILS